MENDPLPLIIRFARALIASEDEVVSKAAFDLVCDYEVALNEALKEQSEETVGRKH